MDNVNSPDQLHTVLKKRLIQFMEDDKQFNVQGSWTGDDGVTVSVIIDFGIQHNDDGGYYVGTVSARYEDNLQHLEDEDLISPPDEDGTTQPQDVDADDLVGVLGESNTFMEAENALIRAIRAVFDVGRYNRLTDLPTTSDIDVVQTIPILYSDWSIDR